MKEKDYIVISFKTVKEKAAEWDISPRHLQYLCKKGVIEGAEKRAGVWLIPDSAPIPLQYSKAFAEKFQFIGTRKRIFDCATKLIREKGFEAVSVKDIADIVGITQSSMYNHFKSKQEILDTIYDFYSHYYTKDRPSLQDIDPVIKNGSLMDIIRCVTYKFGNDYLEQMTDITAILMYRCAIDERAGQLTKSLMIDSGVEFSKMVFDRAVEIGRLAPMDTHSMAVFIRNTKLAMLQLWLLAPHEYLIEREVETKLYQYASKLITDLKPPINNQ